MFQEECFKQKQCWYQRQKYVQVDISKYAKGVVPGTITNEKKENRTLQLNKE
jgi:hypothetical protein